MRLEWYHESIWILLRMISIGGITSPAADTALITVIKVWFSGLAIYSSITPQGTRTSSPPGILI